MKPIFFSGIVTHGRGLGARIGFPTANIKPRQRQSVPPRGIYKVRVSGGKVLGRIAACSVGVRPTVEQNGDTIIEVHVPGFSGNLYGKILKVKFLKKIRNEKKFSSLKSLRQQIAKDIVACLQENAGRPMRSRARRRSIRESGR
ncbi:MAG: riboflavin kinase [Elusimicrobiota bacterium]